jgi:hypothetical protein
MPVYQKLVNFNTLFSQLSEPPIIINDVANTTSVEKEAIQQLVSTRYSTDMITLLPSCRCGVTKGEFSLGVTCIFCGSVVKSSIENDIEPSVWFRRPNGVEKLMSPIIWIMLKNRFRKSGFSVINWLTDTTYRPQIKQPKVIDRIIEAGIQRGYNNFVNNFDVIVDFLFNMKELQPQKAQKDFREEPDYLKILLRKYRDCIFSDYIPLPNKSILIVEKTNVGTYIDQTIGNAIDAIEMLVSIDRDFYDQNPRTKENRTAKAMSKLSEFYEKFYKDDLAPKEGQLRKHVFGSRTNFAFRAVITSLTDTHSYDEIHVPWGIGVTAFRPHLLNKLLNMGFDINNAIGLLLAHVEKYHPLVDRLLEELISESKIGSIPCIIQRN